MIDQTGPGAAQLLSFLRSTRLFAGVAEPVVRALMPQLEPVAYAAGEQVLAEGEPGDCLYLVRAGRLRAVARGPDGVEALLNEVEVGESIGEIAVLTGEPRTASVYAAAPSELLRLSRAQIAQIGRRHPEAADAITRAIIARLERSQLNLALLQSRLFAGLPEPILQELRAALELRLLRGGETLVRQGEASDALYVLINGRLRVVREQAGGGAASLFDLQRGQSVGELGMLTGDARTATVVAVRDSLVARLPRAAFDRLLAAHPEEMLRQFAAPVIRALGEQGGARRATGAVATIAVVPIGRWAPPEGFAEQLAAALGAAGPTMHLSSARLDGLLGRAGAAQTPPDAPASFSLVRWLNEQEAGHSYVVYEADPSASQWTERCLRQADRVLLVADAGDEPTPGPLEQALLGRGGGPHSAGRSLVLLHRPATARPIGTRAWLEGRQLGAHYHIRQGSAPDMARLARLLTGRGVGVVLGGGGAPGFGHVGALRALREAGVPIDLLGGTSQGAVMACQHAMGWDDATTMARNRAAIRHRFDYTFPVTALMAGAEMTAAMREMFGETRLEDLWTPCFCLTANLSRGALTVHERGPIWKYARATTSIPAILPPVVDDGELLVDGGLLNNLPTDIMRRRDDCGVVIAIDTNSGARGRRDSHQPIAYDTALSGWSVLWRRLNPFAPSPRVPTLDSIMVQVAMLNDAQQVQSNRSLADFYLRLQVGAYGLLEFRALEAIVEAGYNSARAYLDGLADGPAFQQVVGRLRPA